MLDIILKIINNNDLDIVYINEHDDVFEAGFDDIELLWAIMDIERKLNIRIADDALDSLTTPHEIYEYALKVLH